MTPEEFVQSVLTQTRHMSRPVYRGQGDSSWTLRSSAVRRLLKAHGNKLLEDEDKLRERVNEYHKDRLIEPMQALEGGKWSDLEKLSVLQHQGAATRLLDFTRNPLVAIWFACDGHPGKDGKVFALDINEGKGMARTVKHYEPNRSLGARVIAQQSVFIVCDPLVPEDFFTSIVVPAQLKDSLKSYLERFGLSKNMLFGDVPGLATANAVNVPLRQTELIPWNEYLDAGHRAHKAQQYEDALAAYTSYAEALPNVAQPYCLMGDTLSALRRFEEARSAYTKAIENLDRPIYVGDGVVVGGEISDTMSRALYFNRGNVQAAVGEHHNAVADFDEALRRGYSPVRDVRYNQGNSYFQLGAFEEAHQDFEAAWSERKGSDAALAMGNCKVMMGQFEDGVSRYVDGTTSEPEQTARACLDSANQASGLAELLDGREYRVSRDGLNVFVEAACIGGSFPFAGNTGNTGNIPSGMVTAHGGKGYKGAKGFSVSIVSPSGPPIMGRVPDEESQ